MGSINAPLPKRERAGSTPQPKAATTAQTTPDDPFKTDWPDGERPRHESLGQRAWLLFQMVRRSPLGWWTQHTGLSPAELLAAEGIPVRVVNVPSEGLFRDQPRSYQESVLPVGVVRYGLTSGLPVNLMGLVGEKGMIHGLDHFGWSAPYTVLDEKFGYNGATVAAEVKKLLGR